MKTKNRYDWHMNNFTETLISLAGRAFCKYSISCLYLIDGLLQLLLHMVEITKIKAELLKLEFKEEPDYDYLITLFQDLLKKRNFEYDNIYP
jgi:hypothetical protein